MGFTDTTFSQCGQRDHNSVAVTGKDSGENYCGPFNELLFFRADTEWFNRKMPEEAKQVAEIMKDVPKDVPKEVPVTKQPIAFTISMKADNNEGAKKVADAKSPGADN